MISTSLYSKATSLTVYSRPDIKHARRKSQKCWIEHQGSKYSQTLQVRNLNQKTWHTT